jgi:hypothetical protein
MDIKATNTKVRIVGPETIEILTGFCGSSTETVKNDSPFIGKTGKTVGSFINVDKYGEKYPMYKVKFDNKTEKIRNVERLINGYVAFPEEALEIIK